MGCTMSLIYVRREAKDAVARLIITAVLRAPFPALHGTRLTICLFVHPFRGLFATLIESRGKILPVPER